MHQGQGKMQHLPPGRVQLHLCYIKVLGVKQQQPQPQLKARVVYKHRHRQTKSAPTKIQPRLRLAGSLRCIHLEGFLHHLLPSSYISVFLIKLFFVFLFSRVKSESLDFGIFWFGFSRLCRFSAREKMKPAYNWLCGHFAKLMKMYIKGVCFFRL
jgi:hypothetical protein